MDKSQFRARIASLTFSEKIKILEKLRDRSIALAASGLRGQKMSNIDMQEQPGAGCTNASHLDPALQNSHTRGHCVPCCNAVRIFGKGTMVDTTKQEHVRYMNTVNPVAH